MITLQRDSGYADRLRAYTVVLDGEVVGKIKNGQRLELNVTPGEHQLHLKIDWCRSNFVDFQFEGAPVAFECGSNFRRKKLPGAIFYVTFGRHKYIWLERKEGGPAATDAGVSSD
jgi:hypothetical protein